jgi:hypothetical protein
MCDSGHWLAIVEQGAEAQGEDESCTRIGNRPRKNVTWAMDFVHDQVYVAVDRDHDGNVRRLQLYLMRAREFDHFGCGGRIGRHADACNIRMTVAL